MGCRRRERRVVARYRGGGIASLNILVVLSIGIFEPVGFKAIDLLGSLPSRTSTTDDGRCGLYWRNGHTDPWDDRRRMGLCGWAASDIIPDGEAS